MNGPVVSPGPGDNRALLSVATQFFVNGLIVASFVPRLPEIRDRIDISTGTLGALLALGSIAGLGGSASVGRLIERFGTRLVLIAGAIVLVGSLAMIGLATTPWLLLLGLATLSWMDVLVDSAMNLQGSWISGRRSVPVMNRLHGLWSLGTVVGGVVASRAAAAGVSLQTHLLVAAGLLLLVVVFVGRGLLTVDEHVGDDGSDLDPERVAATSTSRRPGKRALLVLLGLASGCSIAMEMTSSDWAAFRLSDDFGATAGAAGLAYVAFTVGMTSGRFGGDWAVGRFGAQRVFDVAIAVTVVALVVASFAPAEWMVIVAYVVAGLGVATQFPKIYDDAAKFPGRPGAGLGALTAGSRIALLVTPAVVGGLAATSLSVGAATAFVTIPAAAIFVVVSRAAAR
ncbi:MAG: MFS transporter [Ilumatobacter sp.]|uniref:MFS transporter n=1 Tax=Ilumatobacter sp. TaxID=1967498 RepID=UPI00391D7A6B